MANDAKQPADASKGVTPIESGSNIATMLASQGWGARIRGLVTNVELPEYRSGTNSKGKPYAFWQRNITIFCGRKTDLVREVFDKQEMFQPCAVDAVIDWEIIGGERDGRETMIYTVKR